MRAENGKDSSRRRSCIFVHLGPYIGFRKVTILNSKMTGNRTTINFHKMTAIFVVFFFFLANTIFRFLVFLEFPESVGNSRIKFLSDWYTIKKLSNHFSELKNIFGKNKMISLQNREYIRSTRNTKISSYFLLVVLSFKKKKKLHNKYRSLLSTDNITMDYFKKYRICKNRFNLSTIFNFCV